MICSSIEEWKHPLCILKWRDMVLESKATVNESKFSMLEYSFPTNHSFPPGAVVSAVEATGLIATWNQQHPQEAIGVWDRLLAVNGITKLNENLADELLGSQRCQRCLARFGSLGCSRMFFGIFGNDWWSLVMFDESVKCVVVQKSDVIWYLGCASGVLVGVFGIVPHLDLLLRCAPRIQHNISI